LIVGLLLSLVFGYGDTSLKTVDDVERVLNLPVLCVVPTLKDNDTELAAAEGFRSLRTSIAVSSKAKEPRLLQFTSTSPDEGKTFCALNFAVGLAQQGHKTVLVECDLRRPMAAPSLALVKVDAAGVSDFLKAAAPALAAGPEGSRTRSASDLSFAEIRRKKVEVTDKAEPEPDPAPPATGTLGLDGIVQPTEVPNLWFVAAGKPVANPTELLARPRFEELLNGLLQRYDRVVLDSAPVLGVSETVLIAHRMQGVCFVLRGGQTPRRAILRAVEILRRADVPVLGVVLNGLNPRRSDPYGQDYYYHRANS
jgi:polysaccharide biosynthesis transport protein